jgi:hypothetical protein
MNAGRLKLWPAKARILFAHPIVKLTDHQPAKILIRHWKGFWLNAIPDLLKSYIKFFLAGDYFTERNSRFDLGSDVESEKLFEIFRADFHECN